LTVTGKFPERVKKKPVNVRSEAAGVFRVPGKKNKGHFFDWGNQSPEHNMTSACPEETPVGSIDGSLTSLRAVKEAAPKKEYIRSGKEGGIEIE